MSKSSRETGFGVIGIVVILAVVAIVGVSGWYLFASMNKNNKTGSTSPVSNTSTSPKPSSVYADKKACDLFTLADAQQVFGSGVSASATNGKADTSDAHTSLSNCSYQTQPTGSDLSTMHIGTIVVVGALDSTGKVNIQTKFDSTKNGHPSVDISNLGDKAYYQSDTGLVVVLKDSYILLTSTTDSQVHHSQDQATQIIKLELSKL